MKKIIKLDDLDIVKQQKEMAKKIDKAFERNCLICGQVMQSLQGLTWYCKRCDTLTTVNNVISIRDEGRPDGKRYIE